MSTEIEQLEAAIEIATKRLTELKAAEAAQAEKAWPQNGDRYWTLNGGAEVLVSAWASDDTDQARMAVGNVFRTEADAEREVERRKVLTELRQLARESWGGGKADWSSNDQDKLYLYFSHNDTTWYIGRYATIQYSSVYFATREAAEAAIETIGAERLMLLLED